MYTEYLFTQEREGGKGEIWTKEKEEGQQFTKQGRKYKHYWLYLHDKHLPQSPLFLDDNILLWCL